MYRKTLALAILLIGLSVIVYGLITAPLTNEAEIRINNIYDCRGTELKFYSSNNPNPCEAETARQSKRNYGNSFVYGGLVIMALGGIYTATIIKSKK